MKVLLISSNTAKSPFPVYPLGMSMIAGALQNAGHSVIQFDFLQSGQSLDSIYEIVGKEKPDLVGVSIRNIDNVNMVDEQRYIDQVGDIVRTIRSKSSVKILIGGAGFSILPEKILQEVDADYGFVGEGERLIVDFVNEAAKGNYPAEKIVTAPPNLCGLEICSAAYDQKIMEFYLSSGRMANVQTKRGCTHHCVYCSYPSLEGRKIRCREAVAVVDDIEHLVNDMGAEMIFFTDSVFNDDYGHYLEVLNEMKRRELSIPWTAFIKPEIFSDQQIVLMKETGLCAVELGCDAPSDLTLKKLGKSFGFKEILECSDKFTAHGIAVAHYYMFGCPGETSETIQEGIRNIISLKNAVCFIFMGIRVLPDTALEKIAIRDGVIAEDTEFVEPVYYLAPGICKDELYDTLADSFKPYSHCLFPPNAFEKNLQFLYDMGYCGPLWDLLNPKGPKASWKEQK